MTPSDLQQLYQQVILDHAKARHGASIEPLPPLGDSATVEGGPAIAESYQVNTTCGDEVTVRVSIRTAVPNADEAGDGIQSGRIEELVWQGEGCSLSIAAASVLTDTVRNTSVREARVLLDAYRSMLHAREAAEPNAEALGDAAAFMGVSRYSSRVKCAMLPWEALEAALVTAERR